MSNLEKKREEKMYKEVRAPAAVHFQRLLKLLSCLSYQFVLQLYSRHAQYLSSIVGTEFELPPPNVLRMVLYGEIVSAQNFEFDNLFVRYIVNVPSKGWSHKI